MSRAFLGLFARYPWLAFATIVGMSILSSIGYYDPYLLVSRPADVEAADTPLTKNTNPIATNNRTTSGERRRQAAAAGSVSLFSGDVIMVVTSENFFTPASTQALRAAVAKLQELPQVRSIMWMDEAPPLNVFGMPTPALPDHRASQMRFDHARQQAIANPMIGGQLLSRDGQTALLLIGVDWFHVRKNVDCTRTFETVARNAAVEFSGGEMKFAVTGELPMQLLFKQSTLDNDRKFQWIAYGVVLTLATIIFRGPTAVLITALAPVLGIFWTLGCIRFFQLQDNPFNTVVVPVLLSMVGFTDGVHMMTQIRKHRAAGMTGREAALKAMNEVGAACFLTSLTTAIGFGSLGWAHHDIVREFGWCCVLGVFITFIAVITAIPLACSTWLGRSVHHGHSTGLIESNVGRLNFLLHGILRSPKRFAWAGIGLTVFCILISLQLRPDERMLTAIPESSPEARALRHMDRTFGGLETSTVIVRWNSNIEEDSKEIVAVTEEIENALREEPLLGSPLGIASLVNALPGNGSASEKAGLIELLPTPLKRAFLRTDESQSTIVFRVQDIGIAHYGPVFQRVTGRLQEIVQTHPGFTAELAGAAIWRWKNLYQIIVDLLASLSSAAFIIFVTLGIAYRSIKLGVISIVPNIFPLAATGAGMYFFGSPLELISVLAFTVCLGIAVDDTIHFLTRYTDERKLCHDNDEAIQRSFVGVGSACIMTTIVLVCGFATVLWSDTREHHIFATMGGATIAFAIIGDLVFLPAMLAIFCNKKVPDRSRRSATISKL